MSTGATRMAELVRELRSELEVHNNPERQAFSHLHPSPSGCPQEPYADEAFQIWESLLRRAPDDLRTVHHLAVMYHARAFDGEAKPPDPKQADEHWRKTDDAWRKALELWHRLWREDAFWEDLARGLDDGVPDPFPPVRAAWPEQLLEVHLTIAWDEHTRNHRCRSHVRLALESPFPAEVKESVRMRAYERVTREVSPAAWSSDTFDADTLDKGIASVVRYLELDEGFVPALKDLMGLLGRLQSANVQHANAYGEDREQLESRLREMQRLVGRYEPHVRRLEQGIEQLESDTLSHLVLWHARAGQAHRMLKSFEPAADHCRRAWLAARRDASDPQRTGEMHREWLSCTLLRAREHAIQGKKGRTEAETLLAGIASEELPPVCLMLRANIHMLLERLDDGERDCLSALNLLDNEGTAGEEAELEPQLRQLLEQIRRTHRRLAVEPKLAAASKALAEKQAAKALPLLEEAAKIDPDHAATYFLRAQCHLQGFEIKAGLADLDRVEKLAGEDGQVREAVSRLRHELGELRKLLDQYGGAAALRLQQKAVEAFNSDRFTEAADLLRQALKAANGTDKSLKKELAVCLSLLAVQKTNQAIVLLQTNLPTYAAPLPRPGGRR